VVDTQALGDAVAVVCVGLAEVGKLALDVRP
jgi:hypothetical protein